jgi:diacylglycerol O-acyltransferase
MTQLTGLDTMFLRMERSDMPMHVAALGIYDSSTVPSSGFRYKDVLRFFEARLDRAPIFRRRLVNVPFGMDLPYWIEEGRVDVEYHVRHIALPHPGDWRQLCIQIARIHARPLDLTQPLWEAYVIEGLDHLEGVPPGSFAMYIKMHHAAVDGQGAAAVIAALHSMTPHEHDAAGDVHVLMQDRPLLPLEIALRAATRQAQRIPRLARFVTRAAPRLIQFSGAAMQASRALRDNGGEAIMEQVRAMFRRAPHTRFGGPVSPHRVVEVVRMSLDDVKAIRPKFPGVTVNDILIAVAGGALNKYLAHTHELPQQSLIAQIPVSLREDESAGKHGAHDGGGNVVSSMLVPVHSEIPGAAARLRAVQASATQAKTLTNLIGADMLPRLAQIMPARITAMVAEKLVMPMMNLTISNVRGPQRPMYLAGARAVALIPVSVVTDGLGLNVTALSYDGNIWISIVSCRTMLPDPAFFADCMRASYAELRRAAARIRAGTDDASAPKPEPKPEPKTPASRRAGRASD